MIKENETVTKLNLNALRLNIGFGEGLPEKKVISTVLVRRPNKQTYIRVNPSPEWQLKTAVLELKDEGETYLVAKELWAGLANEITAKVIVSAITRQDSFFFWPIRLPNEDGYIDSWNKSAIECAKIASEKWVRIQSEKDAQSYFPHIAENQDSFPEPGWPKEGFEKLLMIAFKDHYVDSMDHPVIKKLRGVQ